MQQGTPNDRERSPIARLTENEKDCLRRRLLPQTAKEMAIELGVSPHAVEKRLKMARAKLGLSSSLAAARLLAAAEDQLLVPQPPDLPLADGSGNLRTGHGGSRRWLSWSLLTMSITIAAILAVTLTGTPAPAPQPIGAPQDASAQTARVPATPETATAFLGSSFDTMDRDKSGYLDAGETPRMSVRAGAADSNAPLQQLSPERAQAMFVARHDLNGDGKVSRDEFIRSNLPMIETTGIPARWKPHS
jgi:DNA-binding CsgD family transcriptional regulator